MDERIRGLVFSKEYRIANLPHAEELNLKGMGLKYCLLDGGESRAGDVVHMELMGIAAEHVPNDDGGELIKHLFEEYFGFFEKRSCMLEEKSLEHKRLVRNVQIRDVSFISLIPHGGVMGVVKKIMNSGLDNYPESTSYAVFVNPPAVFSLVFAMVKPWLPVSTAKKLVFCSGKDVPHTMMKYIRPKSIEAHAKLLQLKDGDAALDWFKSSESKFKSEFKHSVSAMHAHNLVFALEATGTTKIKWRTLKDDEGKAKITAEVFYVNKAQENCMDPAQVEVHTKSVSGNSVDFEQVFAGLSLNERPSDALLVLHLDNSPSWVMSHEFEIEVEGE